jgi:hypothetical protein
VRGAGSQAYPSNERAAWLQLALVGPRGCASNVAGNVLDWAYGNRITRMWDEQNMARTVAVVGMHTESTHAVHWRQSARLQRPPSASLREGDCLSQA